MKPDSSAIDGAVLALLQGDTALKALMPDGVYRNLAAPAAKRYVLLDIDEWNDVATFVDGRALELGRYLVKAVGLASLNPDIKGAAYRIDQLLEGAHLTVTGYGDVWLDAREDRFDATEPDATDPTIRFLHRGGYYRVTASIPSS